MFAYIYNLIFTEEVFGSGSALWFSPNATHLAYATFYDENVTDFSYFLYGNNRLYPEQATIKYPKVSYNLTLDKYGEILIFTYKLKCNKILHKKNRSRVKYLQF